MVLSTIGVGAAVSPTIVKAWISHFASRKDKHGKPTAHLSYDVGLSLVRQFLHTASHDALEELQNFTAQPLPVPTWVHTEKVVIPTETLYRAVDHLQAQLGPRGIEQVGGQLWWQWRREDEKLGAEWIEMTKDYKLRKQRGTQCERAMMYIHGGAYFFGSVDMHRYQIQRHARKLQARALAPRYRLAPQYPFPCGLLDCLATYLYLLEQQPPETIVLAGDSAGAGMVLSLLIICRDQGIPLPAGAVLISPWVDLTHSFPSVAEDAALDYVPPVGFHHKPSSIWPPPNSVELRKMDELMVPGPDGTKIKRKDYMAELVATARKGRILDESDRRRALGLPNHVTQRSQDLKEKAKANDVEEEDDDDDRRAIPGYGEDLSIVLDGEVVELKDQIQMYAPNTLLAHPLVSPVLQPTLGGLPPLMVLTGGGELLRDEQIYLAHKAANPSAYPPPDMGPDHEREISAALKRYPPTLVQLQVWDDMCHVAPTLSFSRPAKFMYRSVAQFGAWALARAQRTEIRILADDDISDIESDSDEEDTEEKAARKMEEQRLRTEGYNNIHQTPSAVSLTRSIGKAGDPLPPFHKQMIRQRVTRHGEIFPLPPASQLPGCNVPRHDIGVIKRGPVLKWLDAHKWYTEKFAKDFRKIHDKRVQEIEAGGIAVFVEEGIDLTSNVLERPPPTALAGRRRRDLPPRPNKRHSKGVLMWAKYGQSHDEEALEKEEEKIARRENVSVSVTTVRPRTDASAPSRSNTWGRNQNTRGGEGYLMSGGAGAQEQIPAMPNSRYAVVPGQAAESGQASQPPVAQEQMAQQLNGVSAEDYAMTALPQSHSRGASASSNKSKSGRSFGQKIRMTGPAPVIVANTTTGHPTVANDGGVIPFKLASQNTNINPSTATLNNAPGVIPAPVSKFDSVLNETGNDSSGVSVDEDDPVIETAEARRLSAPLSVQSSSHGPRSSWGQGVMSVMPNYNSQQATGEASGKPGSGTQEQSQEPSQGFSHGGGGVAQQVSGERSLQSQRSETSRQQNSYNQQVQMMSNPQRSGPRPSRSNPQLKSPRSNPQLNGTRQPVPQSQQSRSKPVLPQGDHRSNTLYTGQRNPKDYHNVGHVHYLGYQQESDHGGGDSPGASRGGHPGLDWREGYERNGSRGGHVEHAGRGGPVYPRGTYAGVRVPLPRGVSSGRGFAQRGGYPVRGGFDSRGGRGAYGPQHPYGNYQEPRYRDDGRLLMVQRDDPRYASMEPDAHITDEIMRGYT